MTRLSKSSCYAPFVLLTCVGLVHTDMGTINRYFSDLELERLANQTSPVTVPKLENMLYKTVTNLFSSSPVPPPGHLPLGLGDPLLFLAVEGLETDDVVAVGRAAAQDDHGAAHRGGGGAVAVGQEAADL